MYKKLYTFGYTNTHRSKLSLSLIILFMSFTAYSQRERVHLDFDRYTCKSGDTMWFKAYIFQGPYPSSVSTDLYVDVFTGEGTLVQRTLWPIFRGQSAGQLVLADSLLTDNYYIVALTKQQLNYDTLHFSSAPIVVYNKERPNPVHHKKHIQSTATVTAGVIHGIYWVTTLSNGRLSSMLELDSGSAARKLRLVKWERQDSILAADFTLDSGHRSKHAEFLIDVAQQKEILFLYEDSTLIGRQSLPIHNRQPIVRFSADTLDFSPNGYNSWDLKTPDSTAYWMSVSVSDADRSLPSPASIEELNNAYTDDYTIANQLIDSSYITFTGKATRETHLFGGKKIKDPFSREIVLAGVKDSTYLFFKTVPIDDDGNFRLDSLFFFGNIDLQFQINKTEDGSTKNIRLALAKFLPPTIDPSCFNNWVDNEIPIGTEDTFFTKKELSKYELSNIKTLKAAVVTAWKSHRNELDNQYTTGPFSEPAMYSFDLRTYGNPYVHDIFSFLSRECPGLTYNPAIGALSDAFSHPIHYFVDEQEFNPESVRMFDFEKIAYIKVLESDFTLTGRPSFGLAGGSGLKVPIQQTAVNILIYLRKGTDFRTMPGGLNKIAVRGYDSLLPFRSDGVVLLWDPWALGTEYRIRFINNETTRRFLVKVEGVNYSGQLIHFETIVE
jgi:hypothetical protein